MRRGSVYTSLGEESCRPALFISITRRMLTITRTGGGGAERHLPRDKRRSRHRLPMPINRGKAQGLHSRLLILKPTELASNGVSRFANLSIRTEFAVSTIGG